jgi:hypothetical protein
MYGSSIGKCGIALQGRLTTRSKTDARKRRFAPLLAPFNANVRAQMQQRLIVSFVIVGVLSSTAAFTQEAGPRRYLSEEYFRKQSECDTRPPYSRSKFFNDFDYGKSPHQAERPAVWKSQRMFLGDTCFVANVGPAYYTDREERQLAYYSLDVEAPAADPSNAEPNRRSWVVLFRRDINVSELPDGLEKKEIGEVVSYSERERTVRFKIGAHQYAYRLPAP